MKKLPPYYIYSRYVRANEQHSFIVLTLLWLLLLLLLMLWYDPELPRMINSVVLLGRGGGGVGRLRA